MAQLEERLSELLSDDESRQQILRLASMLKNSSSEPNNERVQAESAVNESVEKPSEPDSNDKMGAIFAALPNLLQAMSGSGEGLDGKKVNLIRAISPYISSSRGDYIERAIRLASVAKAARDTLGILGR
jgi:hypothetical protein